MKFRTLITGALILLFNIGISQNSDQIMSDIKTSIKNMNASKLATYFHDRIDLEVGEVDGNYSKRQAEVIMQDFFKKAPVKSFTINHNGSSNDGSKYMIGTYISNSGKEYRVYLLMKKSDEKLRISQLQFEED
ncbi:MAG: DUF4783 domain-containing protein [Bacteroidetes bacterium]|nr:DUF4783 domain-containing protein [Bacteroidota bacterium]